MIDNEELKKRLSKEQYDILVNKGTEPAFTGIYWDHKEKGMYKCAACGTPLFSSESKYDSGSGWPSFTQPSDAENVSAVLDKSYGMIRTEVNCSNCGGHLGHVFNDGPGADGMRYCINSASLDFENGGKQGSTDGQENA